MTTFFSPFRRIFEPGRQARKILSGLAPLTTAGAMVIEFAAAFPITLFLPEAFYRAWHSVLTFYKRTRNACFRRTESPPVAPLGGPHDALSASPHPEGK